MYAIIKNGCQQYKVTEGDSIKVDLISSPEGTAVSFDDVLMAFDDKNSMVVASLIKKFCNNTGEVKIWGDGSPIRDFIYSKDVARMMIDVVEKEISEPINLGSGDGVSISELVDVILNSKHIINKPKIEYEKDKPMGDKIRVLNTQLAKDNSIFPKTSLKDGIDETIEWYLKNINSVDLKFNAFNQK